MSKKKKLLTKFKGSSGPFTWKEITALLSYLGFNEEQAEGSRVLFCRDEVDIVLHKPHPTNDVKHYAVRQLKAKLLAEELI